MAYIEREAAKDELLSWAVCINHPEHLMREDAMHVLDSIPASDVAPARHGRWIETGRGLLGAASYKCSECEQPMPFYNGYKYCPNCGCKMLEDSDGKK